MLADNHVHTQYCPHGSGDDMEGYIKAAINKGLNQITFTEHAPLPIEDPTPEKDSAMSMEDVEKYLSEGRRLKEKYQGDIEVNIGFEVDYIEGKEKQTTEFLRKYPETVSHSILSVHFLKLADQDYFCIDYDKDDFLEKMTEISFTEMSRLYEETLIRALSLPYGKWTPKTIGHITLIYKFIRAHNKKDKIDWERLLSHVKANQYTLDYNFAGIDKPFYGQTYPDQRLVSAALDEGIKFSYGSDAHQSSDVGRYFERGIVHG